MTSIEQITSCIDYMRIPLLEKHGLPRSSTLTVNMLTDILRITLTVYAYRRAFAIDLGECHEDYYWLNVLDTQLNIACELAKQTIMRYGLALLAAAEHPWDHRTMTIEDFLVAQSTLIL